MVDEFRKNHAQRLYGWLCVLGRCIRASGIEVPKGPLFEQALHAEHRHPLRKQGTGGFSCDVCSGSNGFRYRCEKGCDWGTVVHVWMPLWR